MKRSTTVNKLMDAANLQMDHMGFCENRKRVALQKGGLRRTITKVCDESRSYEQRAADYLAIEEGLVLIAKLPESRIQEVIKAWDAEPNSD